ncbi:5050_t:CDS:1 [Dentiscutata erythropus]|uniref:5050_t:CDS:1 n=1 Tax=Dentiscutata erythropus TaxID=1348616 RepID=A0A9N9NSK2_9GLOM|nr:5050_t:CDS:1 [Dentiscutata erythropus]
MAQHSKASKTFEAEAGASDISNIDFDTLLERKSQSETGLTSILESETIRSLLSMMSLDNENIDTGDKEYLESKSSIKKGKKELEKKQKKFKLKQKMIIIL